MTRGYANSNVWRKLRLVWIVLLLPLVFSAIQAAIIAYGSATPLYPIHEATIPNLGIRELTTNWFTLATPAERYLPMTLDVEAGVANTDQWGVWVASGGTFYGFYVRNDGFFKTSDPEWQPFPSIRADVNKLYVYIATAAWNDALLRFTAPLVEPDLQVTFRINNEIAWVGRISTGLNSWGIIAPATGSVEWKSIKIYTSK